MQARLQGRSIFESGLERMEHLCGGFESQGWHLAQGEGGFLIRSAIGITRLDLREAGSLQSEVWAGGLLNAALS